MPTERETKTRHHQGPGEAGVWPAGAIAVLVFGIQQDWLSGRMTPWLIRKCIMGHQHQIQRSNKRNLAEHYFLSSFPLFTNIWMIWKKRKTINKWKSCLKTRAQISSGRSQQIWTQLFWCFWALDLKTLCKGGKCHPSTFVKQGTEASNDGKIQTQSRPSGRWGHTSCVLHTHHPSLTSDTSIPETLSPECTWSFLCKMENEQALQSKSSTSSRVWVERI